MIYNVRKWTRKVIEMKRMMIIIHDNLCSQGWERWSTKNAEIYENIHKKMKNAENYSNFIKMTFFRVLKTRNPRKTRKILIPV